jgi:peroxiredoxin Q/BCP
MTCKGLFATVLGATIAAAGAAWAAESAPAASRAAAAPAPAVEPLAIGAAVPSVSALDQKGNRVDLATATQEGFVLVYFYPKADTPGCTKQACSLRDSFAQLTERGVKVYGVSHDTVADQSAFAEKHSLPFPLLADTAHEVSAAFGVPSRGDYAARQAFLFRDGKLVWRDLEASTAEQAADVLAALDSLGD